MSQGGGAVAVCAVVGRRRRCRAPRRETDASPPRVMSPPRDVVTVARLCRVTDTPPSCVLQSALLHHHFDQLSRVHREESKIEVGATTEAEERSEEERRAPRRHKGTKERRRNEEGTRRQRERRRGANAPPKNGGEGTAKDEARANAEEERANAVCGASEREEGARTRNRGERSERDAAESERTPTRRRGNPNQAERERQRGGEKRSRAAPRVRRSRVVAPPPPRRKTDTVPRDPPRKKANARERKFARGPISRDGGERNHDVVTTLAAQPRHDFK